MSTSYVMKMPTSYALMDNNEMEYLDGGGFSVPKKVFNYTCKFAIMAAIGGLSTCGLKAVLGSMSLKTKLVKTLVKAAGTLGIFVGNTLSNKFVNGLVNDSLGTFIDKIFDKYIDGLDGKKDKKIKIW